MIIWSGWGFLVFLITFGLSWLAEVVVESSLHDERYYQTHGWPLAAALLCAAVVTWYLGSFLNREPQRADINEKTGGDEVQAGVSRNRFFFIPMQYWAPILMVLAMVRLAFR